MPSRCLSSSRARSNSAKAPITESSRVAIAVSSPVKVSCSFTNSTRTPLPVNVRTVQVLPGQPVGEDSVELDAVQLPDDVLVQRADPDVADALTADDPAPDRRCVRLKSRTLS